MHVTVRGAQLAWLREVLSSAPAEATVIVQGHTPVLGPVRSRGSSNLVLEEGAGSRFWGLLREHGVDLYLCGEVHANTALQQGEHEPVQVSYGGLMAWGAVHYLVGKVHPDGLIELELRTLRPTEVVHDPGLWQTAGHGIAGSVALAPSTPVGTLALRDRVIVSRTGELAVYSPQDRPGARGAPGHW